MSEDPQNEASNRELIEKWVSLAESGDTKRLGKLVLEVKAFGLQHLEACTRILMRANAECISANQSSAKTPYYKASVALIEALVQKRAGEELAKLAFFSWTTFEKSPLSVRCLNSAIEVGSLDELYDMGHRMHSKAARKSVECAANLILRVAQAGCRDAYFITGGVHLTQISRESLAK